MAQEFSYFKVGDDIKELVEVVEETKKFMSFANKALAARFDAQGVFLERDDEKQLLNIRSFAFDSKEDVPESWVIDNPNKKGAVMYSANPPEGSEDAAIAEDILSQMIARMSTWSLEAALGLDRATFPMQELPAGKYDGSFVREKTLLSDDFNSYARGAGHKADHVSFCGGSNSAIKRTNPLDYMQFGDDYYLRVPNDEDGNPRYVPDNAELVSLEEMQKIDERDFKISRGMQP